MVVNIKIAYSKLVLEFPNSTSPITNKPHLKFVPIWLKSTASNVHVFAIDIYDIHLVFDGHIVQNMAASWCQHWVWTQYLVVMRQGTTCLP